MTVKNRFRFHKISSNKPRIYFHKALQKYGLDSFYITEVEIPDKDLNEMEMAMIKDYKDAGIKLYNLTDGGDDPPIFRGAAHHNYGRLSKETKAKMRENHADVSGENNPMWKKHHTKESKRKMSVLRKDRKIGCVPIILIRPDGVKEKFDSIRLASKKYNLDSGNLSKLSRAILKKHKGYRCVRC